MTLALSAKVTCDPKRLLESRWVHDTAHAFVHSILRARRAADKPKTRRP